MTTNLPVRYDEKLAQMAQSFSKQVPVASFNNLSTKGGTFRLGETVLGQQLCVIVLDSIWVNTYFPKKWVEGEENSPICYAYGRSKAEMMPHHTMQADLTWFKPQTPMTPNGPAPCEQCQWNEFGSAQTGRGKACQNRDRLAMIPAGIFTPRPRSYDYDLQLFDDPAALANAEIVKLNLPPTSVKPWREYAKKVIASTQRPPLGVISRAVIRPDPKNQFMIEWDMIELVPDNFLEVVLKRADEVVPTMAEAFSPPSGDGPGPQRVQGLQRPPAQLQQPVFSYNQTPYAPQGGYR